MAALSSIAMGVGAAASAASAGVGIAGALQGEDSPSQRFEIQSPEQEFQFLNDVQGQLSDIDQDIQRLSDLDSAYQEKIAIEEARINGTIPPAEAVERLRVLNQGIAEAFSGNTEEAIRNGFMTEEDRAEQTALTNLEGQEGTDPRVEAQLKDSEQNLRDQLRRELGPGFETTEAGRRALDAFNTQAQQLRFSTRQEMINQGYSRAGQRSGIRLASRQQGLAEALGGAEVVSNALRGEREATLVGSQELSRLGGLAYQGGAATIQGRQGLRGEAMNLFKTLGQFDLSKQSKQALESGLVGPGTLFEQSGGISRSDFGRFRDAQREYERSPSRTLINQIKGNYGFVRGNPRAYPSGGYPYGSPIGVMRNRTRSYSRGLY